MSRDPDLEADRKLIVSQLRLSTKPTVFRFSLYGTFVKLSTLRMAFPLLSTYARRSVVAKELLTQTASPCALVECRASIEPRNTHIRKVVIISIELPAIEKRLSFPCANKIVGRMYTWSSRQHYSCECYRNGSKRALHLRGIRLAAVLTVVKNRVGGEGEHSEAALS